MGMSPEQFIELVEKTVTDATDKSAVGTATAISKAVRDSLGVMFPVPGQEETYKTPGEQFANAPAIRNWVDGKGTGLSAPVEVNLPRYGMKVGEFSGPMHAINSNVALANRLIEQATGKDVTASQFPSPRGYLPPQPFPQRRLRLRDLMPVAGIGTPQIEYAQITGYSNNTATVQEGLAKPQSNITTLNVLESAHVVATFMPVTRQALEDVPQLRAWLDGVLEYFLMLVEDNKILNGPGGTDFRGILQTAGVLTQNRGGDTRIDEARKAITRINLAFTDAGFEPTAFAFHPTDWESISLEKDTNGRHLLLGTNSSVADGIPNRLWGLPVVVTPALTQGTGLVGAWDIGAALWTYHGLNIRVSDSHSTYFTQNMLAILAEMRELFTVYFPSAFCRLAGL